MAGFVKFMVFIAVLLGLSVGGSWYVKNPQPARLSAQVAYMKDEMAFLALRSKLDDTMMPEEKLAILKPLAEQGNVVAQIETANMLFGMAVNEPALYKNAVAILKPGVDLGVPLAQNAYGVAVRNGLGGLAADKIEAYKWFSLAARRGLELANANALDVSRHLTTLELAEADKRAEAWLAQYMVQN